MSGPYTKGKNIADLSWNRFLEDLGSDELNVRGGMSAAEYHNMAIPYPDTLPADQELLERLRKHLSQVMKKYRETSGSEREAITSLLTAHGTYCRNLGKPKWKRVHNVMAYRYADKNALTMRMIARKIGKCKEETDNDLMEGQKNMVKLCCGYPSIASGSTDAYGIVEDLLNNYHLLVVAAHVKAEELLPEDIKNIVLQMRKSTDQLIECLNTAIRVYELFCTGYDGIERRRLDVLMARYIEGRKTAPEMAKELNVGLSTVQNDCRMTIKRLSEIMFCKHVNM
ncbi:MAG: hypothetical protein MJ097_02215 [Dorea sp.]|nr:hypothetical protein [Dorea sp.]